MRLCDVGWVWEGQTMDPGVHPSIFGLGEGAKFFGLRKCHFLYHPTTRLALRKLAWMEEVVCDISKWLYRDAGEHGGSENYTRRDFEFVKSEAQKVSRLSLEFPNVTGAINDDTVSGLKKHEHTPQTYGEIYAALKSENPTLKHWWVVYIKELHPETWAGFEEYVDVVSLWQWRYDLNLDEAVDRCAELFPGVPLYLGCYLRDFVKKAPMPIALLEERFEHIVRYLDEGKIAGFAILGAGLIDGHLEQAEWVRDFIARHS